MPPAMGGRWDVNIKWTEESDIELSGKKKKKKGGKTVVVFPTDMTSTVLS